MSQVGTQLVYRVEDHENIQNIAELDIKCKIKINENNIDNDQTATDHQFKQTLFDLKQWVIRDCRVITAQFLLRHTPLDVTETQRLMKQFLHNHLADNVYATYRVIGSVSKDSDGATKKYVTICHQDKLDRVSSNFTTLHCVNIYSLQMNKQVEMSMLHSEDILDKKGARKSDEHLPVHHLLDKAHIYHSKGRLSMKRNLDNSARKNKFSTIVKKENLEEKPTKLEIQVEAKEAVTYSLTEDDFWTGDDELDVMDIGPLSTTKKINTNKLSEKEHRKVSKYNEEKLDNESKEKEIDSQELFSNSLSMKRPRRIVIDDDEEENDNSVDNECSRDNSIFPEKPQMSVNGSSASCRFGSELASSFRRERVQERFVDEDGMEVVRSVTRLIETNDIDICKTSTQESESKKNEDQSIRPRRPPIQNVQITDKTTKKKAVVNKKASDQPKINSFFFSMNKK